VLIAYDSMHAIGKRKRKKPPCVCSKVDMIKAYDRVE
jgi:hypothetical protein